MTCLMTKSLNFLVLHLLGVLRGDDDRVDAHRLVAVVFDGDLALAVGAQPVHVAVLAGVGQRD